VARAEAKGYLLDTHVLLWADTAPSQLPSQVRVILRDPNNRIFVSSATAWELATKFRLGRLPEAANLVTAFGARLAQYQFQELPIYSQHSLLAGSLQHQHRDPFDRLLVAQSQLEQLLLISADLIVQEMAGLLAFWK
jgi:PIN domain nuclease of toxin-antitoxin system